MEIQTKPLEAWEVKSDIEERIEKLISRACRRINKKLSKNFSSLDKKGYISINLERALAGFFNPGNEILEEAEKRIVQNYSSAGWWIRGDYIKNLYGPSLDLPGKYRFTLLNLMEKPK